MKLSFLTSIISVAAVASSSAALYTSNFNSFTGPPANFAGQGDWVINDPATGLSSIGELSGSPALALGGDFAATTTPSVALTQSFVESVGRVSATFDFTFVDSDEAIAGARDAFSFSLNGASGKLFEISFLPLEQSATPSTTTGQWSAFYSVNGGSSVPLVFTTLDEGGAFGFDLAMGGFFTPGNTTTTNFVLKLITGPALTDTLTRTGSVALDPNTATTGFGFNYTPTNGTGNNGSNSLVVDNLTVVPEPSSSLLLALTSLGLITRRRRA